MKEIKIYACIPIISLGYGWGNKTFPLIALCSFIPLVMAGIHFGHFLGIIPFQGMPLAFLHEHSFGECVILGVLMAHTNNSNNKLLNK